MSNPNYNCNICCCHLVIAHPSGKLDGISLGWLTGSLLLHATPRAADGHVHFCESCHANLESYFQELAKPKAQSSALLKEGE